MTESMSSGSMISMINLESLILFMVLNVQEDEAGFILVFIHYLNDQLDGR